MLMLISTGCNYGLFFNHRGPVLELQYAVLYTYSYRHYQSIAQLQGNKTKNNNLVVFLHSQCLCGHLFLTTLVAAFEHYFRKRPAPVMDSVFAS